MREPENGEFKQDERGIMTDPEEMLFVIHELACALGTLTEDVRVRMLLGPDALYLNWMAQGAHELSCDKHLAEPEKKELGNPVPGFNLGDELNKLIGDL